MAQPRHKLTDYLYRVIRPDPEADTSDADLLDRFQMSRDEAAFSELVRRHGPVVHGVCARVLTNPADVEDAFQVTFIVLVRQVASINRRRPLVGWLYTVAYRTAVKARLRRSQLLALERRIPPMPPTEQSDDLDRQELCAVLDEELQRLPAVDRDLLILCDMQGCTQTEAAAMLNRPLGSVSRLLGGARERLRARLARRGIFAPAVLLAGVLAQKGTAAVPAGLLTRTIRAALAHTDVAAPADGLSELARQVSYGSMASRVKVVATGLFAVTLAGVGAFYNARLFELPSVAPPTHTVRPDSDSKGAKPARASAPVFRHGSAVTALAASADGRHVASAGADRMIRVWDRETGSELVRFQAPPEGVASLAFSPDRNELLVEDSRVGLAIWSLDTGRRRKNHLGQWFGVEALAYSHDGRRLATVGRDGKLVWLDLTVPQSTQRDPDWESKELTAKSVARFFAPTDPVKRASRHRAIAFTADGAAVYTIDRELNLTRMDVPSGRTEVSKLKPDPMAGLPSTTVAVSPGAHWVAWGGRDKRVGLAELPSGRFRRLLHGHEAEVVALAFAPDCRGLASVDANGRLIHTSLPNTGGGEFESRAADFRLRATVLAVSPDGKCIYGAGVGGEVHCWDVASLERIQPTSDRE